MTAEEMVMETGSTLYYNALVHTMDEGNPRADALLVEGNRLVAVGSREEVQAAAKGPCERVDLEGQTVVPGFNDSHCHIIHFGLTLQQVDVSADAVRTVEDVKVAVRRRAQETAPNEWIVGRGYDQNVLAEQRHPTRQDLDEASGTHPIVLHHTSGHVLTSNSRALELAGITADTAEPAGGAIDRDEHGEPTGLLKEAAMELLDRVVPPPSIEEGTDAILHAMRTFARYGITSASDAATGDGDSIDPTLQMYRNALQSSRLAGRITLMPQIYFTAPPDSDRARRPEEFDVGDEPQWLQIGATKIFSDGALSTRTAALREPYADDPSNSGILLWEQQTLAGMIARANAAGWQIATHALGDRAVEVVLDAYEAALQAHPRRDHRHRIEHCMVADEGLGERILRLGVVPSLQPDIFRLGDGYVAGLGLERASASIPVGLFRRLGVPMAFSSDCPVIPCDPIPIVRSAVERVTPRGVRLGTEHAVTVMEAVRLYTAGGAFATHADGLKGTLRPGMLADFTVLSTDLSAVPVEDLDGVRVTLTVVGGRESYRA